VEPSKVWVSNYVQARSQCARRVRGTNFTETEKFLSAIWIASSYIMSVFQNILGKFGRGRGPECRPLHTFVKMMNCTSCHYKLILDNIWQILLLNKNKRVTMRAQVGHSNINTQVL